MVYRWAQQAAMDAACDAANGVQQGHRHSPAATRPPPIDLDPVLSRPNIDPIRAKQGGGGGQAITLLHP